MLVDCDECFELAEIHVSSIEMRGIGFIDLIDTREFVILVSACFTETPPSVEPRFCKRTNHPPWLVLLCFPGWLA